LVKAFLKAAIVTETGHLEEFDTGTPYGGILSPLLANIARSCGPHLMRWLPPGRQRTMLSNRSSGTNTGWLLLIASCPGAVAARGSAFA
jgi:hypothetical protein